MKVSEALERVWQWKEQVYHQIKEMTCSQRMAHFKQAQQRFEAKTGLKLHLPRVSRRRQK